MAGRRLVLVRHGQTEWNRVGRAQGHLNVSLDDTGRSQAETMAPVVAELDPVELWSSDLARARETAAYLEKLTGLTAREDARLREFDIGERAGLTVPEFAERYPDAYASWKAGHVTGGVPGAETPEQVVARMVPALEEALAGTPRGECTVVVAHGACIRASVLQLLGLPITSSIFRGMDNCGWTTLEDDPAGRGVRLMSYNETATAQHGPDFASDAPVG